MGSVAVHNVVRPRCVRARTTFGAYSALNVVRPGLETGPHDVWRLVRIRLAPFGRSGGSASDLVVGGGLVERSEAEQRLEGGHRRSASVVAEGVLVEVD